MQDAFCDISNCAGGNVPNYREAEIPDCRHSVGPHQDVLALEVPERETLWICLELVDESETLWICPELVDDGDL